MTHTYQIGDVLEGTVTGIQKYGIFVKLDDKTQGLIHISECESGYVTDLSEIVTIGQTLKVIILDIDEYSGKISLSLRYLKDDFVPKAPYRQRYLPKRQVPDIGFKTLEQKMDTWIQEARMDIEMDKLNILKKEK